MPARTTRSIDEDLDDPGVSESVPPSDSDDGRWQLLERILLWLRRDVTGGLGFWLIDRVRAR